MTHLHPSHLSNSFPVYFSINAQAYDHKPSLHTFLSHIRQSHGPHAAHQSSLPHFSERIQFKRGPRTVQYMIVKEGYMFKKGKKLKGWHRRFFTIMDRQLQCFKAPGLPLKTAIDITSPDMVELAPECKRQPTFRVTVNKKKVLFLSPDSAEEANSWVEALKRTAKGVDLVPIRSFNDLEVVRTLVEKPNGSRIDLVNVRGGDCKCVLKRYPRTLFKDPNSVICEKSEFLKLMNPFVTPLLKLLQDGSELGFVLEYAQNGCLFGYLWSFPKFCESQVLLYAAELVVGLSFMHRKGTFYGDLSPLCVLMGEDGHVMLSDPGLFPEVGKVTPYSAPELFQEEAVATEAADWYSLGAIIYEMLTGMPPFFGDDDEGLKASILKDNVMFPYHVSRPARDLVQRLMAKNPAERIGCGSGGADEVMNHEFFASVTWADISGKRNKPNFVPTASDERYETISINLF